MYKKLTFKGLLLFTLIITAVNLTHAQSNSGNPNKAWSLNVNLGPSFLWGDMSDDVSNPFTKAFSSEFSMSYGVLARKGLSNVFGVNAQVILGNTSGSRDFWSNGTPTGGYNYKNFFTEVNLNLDIDILNIFNAKDRRLINPYIKGGAGMTYFNTEVMYKGVTQNSEQQAAFILPFGGGIRLDITPRLGITIDQAVTYTFTDLFDGYSTQWSKANDWYTYTSVGLTYRFVSKDKKKKYDYEEEAIPDNNEVADNNEVETVITKPKVEFQIVADVPSEITQGDTFIVSIKVTKGDRLINGKAKLQQTLPIGFEATQGQSQGGKFGFINQVLTYTWNEIPQGSSFSVDYTVTTIEANTGEFTIPGVIFYTQDSVDMIKQFRKDVNVKSFAEKNQMLVVKKESKLLYRVQVQAIYGGKTSAKDIQQRYNLNEDVNIDYEGGYTKYTVGGFATYDEAKIYRDKLRDNGAPGAFVVGYYDGSRIRDIKQAVTIEDAGTETMVVVAASTKNENSIYRVQVAASTINRSEYQIQSKYGLKDKVTKTFMGGLYKYSIGKYTSYSDASKKLKEIRVIVPDAFIVVSEIK
ncbi:MAG: hypothetical protein DRI84_03700 [Bacteroidetes bacterium]|nr:MAG: hypothetical protein DRI84_03700 [Bacteroidota bacterium]